MTQSQKTVRPARSVAQTRQSAAAKAGSAFTVTVPRLERRAVARSVGAFVPRLTQTAFEKFGFSTAQLLTDWPVIAGAKLATMTIPDKIVWPRRVGQGADEGGSATGARSGATLHLRVDPSRALDVQYGSALLIDRINAYFGYRAVSDIRLLQVPMPGQSTAAHVPQMGLKPTVQARPPEPALVGIQDEGLRAALERMSAGISSRRG